MFVAVGIARSWRNRTRLTGRLRHFLLPDPGYHLAMARERTLGMVEDFYGQIWNAGDEEAALRLLASDLRFRGSTGMGLVGVGPFLEYVRLIRRALADYRCEIEEV